MQQLEPSTEIAVTSLNSSGWFEFGVVCYSCSNLEVFDEKSCSQPWIWSTNQMQDFENADDRVELLKHDYFGHFVMDMTKAAGQPGTTSCPKISGWGTSGGGEGGQHGGDGSGGRVYGKPYHKEQLQATSSLAGLHGITATITFIILLPCWLISTNGNSKSRILVQSLTALLAMAVIATSSWEYISEGEAKTQKPALLEPHAILGLLLYMLLGLQVTVECLYRRRCSARWPTSRATNMARIQIVLICVIGMGASLNTWL